MYPATLLGAAGTDCVATHNGGYWWQQLGAAGAVAIAMGALNPGWLRIVRRNSRGLRSVFTGYDRRTSTSKSLPILWTAVLLYGLVALLIIERSAHLDSPCGDGYWAVALAHLDPVYLVLIGGPFATAVLAKVTVANQVRRGDIQKVTAEQDVDVKGPGSKTSAGTSAAGSTAATSPTPAGAESPAGSAPAAEASSTMSGASEASPEEPTVREAGASATGPTDQPTKQPAGQPPTGVLDLVRADDGGTDLVDLQYVLFNLLAMGYVLALFMAHPAHGLPAIPAQLAALTGTSAATYVTNKATANTRATLSAVSPTHARADDQVTVYGTNLLPQGGRANSTEVLVNGLKVAEVVTSRSERITFAVPRYPNTEGGAWPFPYDAAKTVDVTVTTAAGQQVVLPAALHLYQSTASK
ncbi:IPT/TIG domain-containing protein [Streptomyces sp. MBT62]|uniref:IPT/TIG domain-containing protein n=1 Tax=Streptomyces sp. MBT62 TaxID=2800410 RepID=UPI00190B3A3E|nr:IPT/TIG domain-containing protein [Streptomyces sp. MBT62]MBK3564497.1 hypothetical protein [Streptomyces sp. MBT62]